MVHKQKYNKILTNSQDLLNHLTIYDEGVMCDISPICLSLSTQSNPSPNEGHITSFLQQSVLLPATTYLLNP